MKRTATKGELAFCSIISKNYLGQVRVLAESLRTHHPDAPLFVLLLDPPDGYFRPKTEPFTLLSLDDVLGDDAPRFRFQYTPFELSCAAKPYLVAHLFEHYGIRKLAYFDSDIMVFHPLRHLEQLLDDHSLVITPHLTAPYDDDKHPTELAIVQAGTFNMGFFAVRNSQPANAFLAWWKRRLDRECLHAVERGMFVDQKWVNLAPGLFDDVCILRDPGYNVAYWNLHCRSVTARHGVFTVNGSPCYFFHFSGYDPADERSISKHQNRLAIEQIGAARLLLNKYRNRLAAHDHDVCRRWPYTWAVFDNGVVIPDFVRRYYLQVGAAARFGNPFAAAGTHSFFHWLTAADGAHLPPLLKAIHEVRPDLRAAFPEAEGKDRSAIIHWALTHGLREMRLDAAFEPRLRSALTNPGRITSPLGRGGPVTEGFGVNLLGFLQSEKGMGEHCRATIRALKAAGIPHALNNWVDPSSANLDADCSAFRTDNPYPINLIHLNAIDAPFLYKEIPAYFHGRYNVGYWNWELDWFPEEWRGSFQFFDEIWAPSTFSQKSYSRLSPIPVHWVPISIAIPPSSSPTVSRERFQLPRDAFVFLFAFDFHSYFARKNPVAVIEAFRRAFPQRRDVVLALKLSHWESVPVEFMEVLTACRGQANIRILRDILSRDEMYDLLRVCDAYVGLHRSEGYGLPLVEAMALGKPVIGTGYSGNVDFMNERNSFPVRYRLVAIEQDHGPYRRGAEWAEPDVDHAAEQMRRVVEAPAATAQVAARARADIERLLSPHAIGHVMRNRLTALLQRGAPAIDERIAPETKRQAA